MNKTNIFKCLMIISLFFSQINFNIGFYVRPFMIFGIIYFIYDFLLRKKRNLKISNLELLYLIFIIYISINMFFSVDQAGSIRYFWGIILVVFTMFQYKKAIFTFDKNTFEKTISYFGIVYAIFTLLYYLLGLFNLGFNYHGNEIISYGVLIDRNVPRIISLASSDPNITCIYFSFFLSYYMSNLNNKRNYFGFVIYFLLILLSMSRGAYLSLLLLIVFYELLSKEKAFIKLKKILLCSFLIFIPVFFISFKYNLSISDTMSTRFESSAIDHGSGRTTLWKNAITTFFKKPIVGIGINSSLSYNRIEYGTKNYIHNTYLEVLSELGIIGFIIYLVIFVKIILLNLKNLKVSTFPFCYMISVLIQYFFLSLLINENSYILIIITLLYQKFLIEKKVN